MSGMSCDLPRTSGRYARRFRRYCGSHASAHICFPFGYPGDQVGNAVLPMFWHGKFQPIPDRARIADVVALIAGAPIRKLDIDPPAEPRFDKAQNLFEADPIIRAAAEIEGAPGDMPDIPPSREIGLNRVKDMQHVAHLTAVAINGDRLASERTIDEMRNPALIFRAHLVRAVDAAHAHDPGQQAETAAIIDNVLVRRTLGAAIGCVEIERPTFVDTVAAQACVLRQVAVILACELDV